MYVKFRENKPRKDHRGADLIREFCGNASVIFDGGYLVRIYENGDQIEEFEVVGRTEMFTALSQFMDKALSDGYTQVDGQAMRQIYNRAKNLPEQEEDEAIAMKGA